ncbi:MAG TPA: hypothetical protein VGA68_09420 [Woeseiaceae bacterium]
MSTPTGSSIDRLFLSQNIDWRESHLRNGKMDTRKSNQDIALRKSPPGDATPDQNRATILRSSLAIPDELSIADDCDLGGDPYNSTGQYCIVKSKPIADE